MMETAFTPWASLIGGALIGLASVLLMAFHGRIMGATGILAGVLFPAGSRDWAWRVAILAGMVTAPLVYFVFAGGFPEITATTTLPMMAVGGVIVGIGVSYGSGCTSGHGVCGLARLSPRSIAATLAFMAGTAVTVYVLRHVIGG